MATSTRLKPAQLWHAVVDEYVSSVRVTPQKLTATIAAGRTKPHIINQLISVVETAKIINRIMGKEEHNGVNKRV